MVAATAAAAAANGDSDKSFVKVTSKSYIHLEPHYLGNIHAGIEAHFTNIIGSYVESLGGVPVSYEDPQTEQKSGAISGDSPFIHFYVSTEYTVFAPEVGHQLLGEVNKVTSDHIGLLVFNTFNASVSKENISSQYEFDPELSRWCDRDFDNPVIEVGSKVLFTVASVETLGDKLSIKGTLTKPNTGPVQGGRLDVTSPSAVHGTKKKSKKKRKRESESTDDPASVVEQKKKKKKQEVASSNDDDGSSVEHVTDSGSKKKPKKEKKSKKSKSKEKGI